MALIKCVCETVHDLTLPVCPGCGRCPACGARRVSKQEMARLAACATCGVPYCSGCGRCHVCGTIRFAEMGPHSCGFPADEEKVRSVEKAFGLHRRGIGCSAPAIAVVLFGAGWLAFA